MSSDMFLSVDPYDKKNDRGYTALHRGVGKPLFFFGMKGWEPAYILVPFAFFSVILPMYIGYFGLASIFIWFCVWVLRAFTKHYRWTQLVYWLCFRINRGIQFPKKERLRPYGG